MILAVHFAKTARPTNASMRLVKIRLILSLRLPLWRRSEDLHSPNIFMNNIHFTPRIANRCLVYIRNASRILENIFYTTLALFVKSSNILKGNDVFLKISRNA